MTVIMGIVNVTPDSFSDGGRYLDADSAVAHGRALRAAGADLLDVGGESTRPGAERPSEDERWGRVTALVGQIRIDLQNAGTGPLSDDLADLYDDEGLPR